MTRWIRSRSWEELSSPRRVGAIAALLLIATGCGSPTSPSATSACPTGYVSKGSMSARIDGAPWVAKCVTVAINAGGSLYVVGFDDAIDSGHAQGIAFHAATTWTSPSPVDLVPGTYPIGGPSSPYGPSSEAYLSVYCTPGQKDLNNLTSCSGWAAVSNVGGGAITVTILTIQGAAGTFSFDLPPAFAATGTRRVTDGAFDVKF